MLKKLILKKKGSRRARELHCSLFLSEQCNSLALFSAINMNSARKA